MKPLQQLKIGILGGGQLGRMILQEAISLHLDIHILDPAENAPCAPICNNFSVGDFNDYETVMRFGANKDIVTIEIEHVNTQALLHLQEKGVKVFPQPQVIDLIKDKGLQKLFYQKHQIPTAPFQLFEAKPQAEILQFPCVQKLRTGGYDGRGVQILKSYADMSKAFDAPCLVEEAVNFQKELAVIVHRNASGEMSTFPVVEMEFNPHSNLVEFLFAPAQVDEHTAEKAREIAQNCALALNITGTLAVEFFMLSDGNLLVNECAPRVHNSGHHTIESNVTSQFMQHLRAICNLPLGDTAIKTPGVMVNLVGAENHSGKVYYNGLDEVLKISGAYPHIYGKEETKPHRKMGHITVCHPDIEEAKNTARKIMKMISVESMA